MIKLTRDQISKLLPDHEAIKAVEALLRGGGGTAATAASSFGALRLTTNAVNVTGDGTVVYVRFDTKSWDYNGDYSASTGIFTVPETGIYSVHARVFMTGPSSHVEYGIHLYETTGPSIIAEVGAGAPSGTVTEWIPTISGPVRLLAGQKIMVGVLVGSGLRNVDIPPHAYRTGFSACRIG